MRSLSPSTTRVWTRTESPTLNAGNSVLNWSFSIASMMRFMATPFAGAQSPRMRAKRKYGSAEDRAGIDCEHEQERRNGLNGCDRLSGNYNHAPPLAPVAQLDR